MNIKVYNSTCEEDTEEIASCLAKYIPFGSVIALEGNLGAGKTVFARGFIKGFEIDEVVSSPTFTLIKEYLAGKDNWIYHLDLYRITDIESALVFGIDEYINDDNSIALIEWAERIDEILPENTIKVKIKTVDKNTRKITVETQKSENLPDIE